MTWYIKAKGGPSGPHTVDNIRILIQSGKIPPTAKVLGLDPEGPWGTANDFPELRPPREGPKANRLGVLAAVGAVVGVGLLGVVGLVALVVSGSGYGRGEPGPRPGVVKNGGASGKPEKAVPKKTARPVVTTKPITTKTSKTKKSMTPEEIKQLVDDVWSKAREKDVRDDVGVLATVTIKKIEVTTPTGKTKSEDYLAVVVVAIKNLSKTKKIKYIPWGTGEVGYKTTARLMDNLGNQYDPAVFPGKFVIEGNKTRPVSIYPGDFDFDVLLFERPVLVKELKELRLVLPLKNVGIESEYPYFMLRISADDIKAIIEKEDRKS